MMPIRLLAPVSSSNLYQDSIPHYGSKIKGPGYSIIPASGATGLLHIDDCRYLEYRQEHTDDYSAYYYAQKCYYQGLDHAC